MRLTQTLSLAFILWFFGINLSFSQEVLYSESCKCGIKVLTYNNTRSNKSGQLNTTIPLNSTLKRALLITNFISVDTSIFQNAKIPISKIDNYPISPLEPMFDISAADLTVDIDKPYKNYRLTTMMEITDLISGKNQVTLTPPSSNINSGIPTPTTDAYILVLIYFNEDLNPSSFTIVNRKKDVTPTQSFQLDKLLNPVDLNFPVILSVNSSNICHTDWDGSYVKVNDSTLGLIGGEEPNAASSFCSGVQGEFQYDGHFMQALGDDTLNNTMNNTDGIANVAPYLNPNGTNLVSFEYQKLELSYSSGTNPIHQLVFAYTSTCPEIPLEIQEQNDVCEGDFLQLEATGADEYQWEPQVGLSCYDCPNPIVTTDSSRVWRLKAIVDDSCFVVRPVQVHVRKLGFGSVETLPSICAEQTGQIEIAQPNHHIQALSYSLNGGAQTTSNSTGHTFQNISSGTYTLTQHNGVCDFDTTLVIADSQIVIADFIPSPESGAIPFNCYFKDLSTFSTDLTWFVDGEVISEDFYTHRFEEAGEHEVILITHRKDSLCADTASMFVLAYEDIFLSLPNIITANGDGINDELLVRSNQPANLQYSIVNRWGNTAHQGELEINKEEPLSLWNGGDLIEGTYFLKVIATPTTGYAPESRSFETFFRLER